LRPVYRPPAPGWERWTASDLEQYLRCGLAYFRRRDSAERRRNVALVTGTAIHRAAADHARKLMLSGSGMRLVELVDTAVAAYDEEAESGEMAEPAGEWRRAADYVAGAAHEYGLRLAPRARDLLDEEILAVEEPMYAYLETGGYAIELAGTLDRASRPLDPSSPRAGAVEVADIKTGRRWSEVDVASNRQLSVYAELYTATFGSRPRRVGVENVASSSRASGVWYGSRIVGRRSEADREALWSVLKAATDGRRAGVALPAPNGAWWCSKKWCPYWSDCPAVIGRG